MDNRKIEKIIIEFHNERYPGETNGEFMETVVECRQKLVKLFAIPDVSSRLSFARFVAKSYDIRTDGNRTTYAEIATGDNYTESEIYKKWQLLNGC